ncbi:MAG: GNAT family N-acetyltransferase [Oscillospiraceae bacterium]|nr:GNAT family N-acetyltransferase [Oscillospiraceae bacterium]
MYRTCTQEDVTTLKQLWHAAFGDDDSFMNKVFGGFAPLNSIYVVEQAEGIVAMACAVPVSCNDRKGVYLYGVNTKKEMRGQGIMKGLLLHIHKECAKAGIVFSVLIPAEESLFEWYGSFGYETMFTRRTLTRLIKRNIWAQADFDTVTAKKLEQLRKQFIKKNYIDHTAKGYESIVFEMYSGGASSVVNSFGYGIYYKNKDMLTFIELFSQNDVFAEQLIEAARERTGCEKAQVILPQGSTLFLGEGKFAPYGMLKYLDEPFRLDEPYMGLMMD